MPNCFIVEKVLAYDGIILDVASTSVKQQSFMQSSDCDSQLWRRRSLETIVPSHKDNGIIETVVPSQKDFWLKILPALVFLCLVLCSYIHGVYLDLVKKNVRV